MRNCNFRPQELYGLLRCPPQAVAQLESGPDYPRLRGLVRFYEGPDFVLVVPWVQGLPDGFYAFHIHEGTDCGGAQFADSKGHFDPLGRPHPDHAGDLPPLLSCGGEALALTRTCRFRLCQVLGRTVIVHKNPDDFHTQPSGNAGEKIACGVIRCCRP